MIAVADLTRVGELTVDGIKYALGFLDDTARSVDSLFFDMKCHFYLSSSSGHTSAISGKVLQALGQPQ